jgi:phenylalanyl-tRNA synthetase beta chain
MKAVWSWLMELVDLDRAPTVEEGARALTGAGLEVEGLTDLGAGFRGVVVAEVVGQRRHPGADQLTLVDVQTERGGAATQVVCGAPNVPAPGQRVLWAPPGAVLPGGLTLGVKAVKGVDSPGMLCSEVELQIGEDASGILVLTPEEAPVLGAPAQEPLGLADHLLEINVPANRGDCLGHLGLARELAALFGGRLVPPAPALEDLTDPDLEVEELVEVTVDDPAGCPTYVARVIDGLIVRPSPRRLQQRLRAVGVRPLSNLVDVTNYVMFELGQPLHAFDWAHVAGARIRVRRARAGERMTTLDAADRALLAEDLLICDADRPVAIAGVMGGLDSEVTGETSRVLLESASFEPRSVRRTARRLGLHSEASHRFERGVDPSLCELASARAAELLARLGDGRIADGAVDEHGLITVGRVVERPRRPRSVSLRVPRARAVTGVELDAATCRDVLARLGMTVTTTGEPEILAVEVPPGRADVAREIDLVEEVMRVVGYEQVPATLPALRAAPVRTADDRPDRARRALVAAGLTEAITFGFHGVERLAALRLPPGDRRAAPIALRNPMSADQAILRTSLVPNLLAAVARNLSFGRPDVALFEVGNVFWRGEGEAPEGELTRLGDEPVHATAVLAGARPHRLTAAEPWDVFDARGIAEALLAAMTVEAPRLAPTGEVPYLHPGVAARIVVGDAVVGELGEVHPATREVFGIEVPVFLIDVALSRFGAAPVRQMQPIPRFPASARDVSLLLAEAIPAGRVEALIGAAASPLVESARVLEDYRGEQLPAGHKSMLWSITYRAADRTLTDAEVDAAHEAIVAQLVTDLPAQRR